MFGCKSTKPVQSQSTETVVENIVDEEYVRSINDVSVSWEEFSTKLITNKGDWWHFYAHMCPDFSKAERLLGYKPKYDTKATLKRSVEWMKKEGII